MAQGVNFDGNNKFFGKPKDWTNEQCYTLPVQVGVVPLDDKGNESIVLESCWQFSPEEIEEIVKTGKAWLLIHGLGMPPVSVNAFKTLSNEQTAAFFEDNESGIS